MSHRRALVIAGPTAVGKTAVALALAQEIDCEIISADSRQVYRYMNIGTAKPTAQELQAVPHHFVDIKDPDEYYSAGQFGSEARTCVQEIFSRGRLPLIVGGSGLYIRGLLDGFFGAQIADAAIKARLKQEVAEGGLAALYQRLQQVDPVLAARLQPTDQQRILRALEVFEITRKPLSGFLEREPQPAAFNYDFVALDKPRELLYERIDARVERMLGQGFLHEVRQLQQRGYQRDLNALQTVGYREAFAHLQGELTLDEMVTTMKRKSRNYAKRQLTWFRSDSRVQWLQVAGGSDARTLAQKIRRGFLRAAD